MPAPGCKAAVLAAVRSCEASASQGRRASCEALCAVVLRPNLVLQKMHAGSRPRTQCRGGAEMSAAAVGVLPVTACKGECSSVMLCVGTSLGARAGFGLAVGCIAETSADAEARSARSRREDGRIRPYPPVTFDPTLLWLQKPCQHGRVKLQFHDMAT